MFTDWLLSGCSNAENIYLLMVFNSFFSIIELIKSICQGFQHSFWILNISGSMRLLEKARKQGT